MLLQAFWVEKPEEDFMSTVELRVDERIATLTFNRPEALNALNREVLMDLKKHIDDLKTRSDVSVVVLTGAGEKAFVAGADIKQMSAFSPLDASCFADFGQSVLFGLEHLPQVTIAMVNGFALGGGCEIAMACDLIYASEKAKFGQPEINLGVIPGFGGTQRLLRWVGPQKARELIYTGNMIKADQALEMGLVAGVFSKETFVEETLKIAGQIADKGTEAVYRAKTALREGMNTDLNRACLIEREQFALCFDHPDQKEGMNAFLEKRKPNWRR